MFISKDANIQQWNSDQTGTVNLFNYYPNTNIWEQHSRNTDVFKTTDNVIPDGERAIYFKYTVVERIFTGVSPTSPVPNTPVGTSYHDIQMEIFWSEERTPETRLYYHDMSTAIWQGKEQTLVDTFVDNSVFYITMGGQTNEHIFFRNLKYHPV